MAIPIKLNFLERARQTRKFHSTKCRESPKWKILDTAKALRRSPGSICEDLLLASWYKTHGPQLEQCVSAKEALEFIRERKRSRDLEDDSDDRED